MPIKLAQTESISRAKSVHGGKYDYSKWVYNGNKEKCTIICPDHGEFTQTPDGHFSGRGCPKCGGSEKITQRESIEKSIKVHEGRYDYSNWEYVNSNTKVKIICPDHGEFQQTPRNHWRGDGCPCCGNIQIGDKLSLGGTQSIERAKSIHGDRYDYSDWSYVNNSTKVKIVCKKHGPFYQTPSNHFAGKGCPECKKDIVAKARRLTQACSISKAIEIHGDKYDYSHWKYENSQTKTKIICPKHGLFYQKPANHFAGNGCPKCGKNQSRGELKIELFLKETGTSYETEYRLAKTRLKCDFFLPNNNTIIEYDGRQHFKPIDFFGGEKGLTATQKRDSRKNAIAEKMGLKMIRIPYWDYDNIESILQKHLLQKSN